MSLNSILFAVFNGYPFTANDSLINEKSSLKIRKKAMKECVSVWAEWNQAKFARFNTSVTEIQAEIDAMNSNEFNNAIKCLLTDSVPLLELLKIINDWKIKK